MPDKKYIHKALLRWFEENKRKLPWREEKDAYKIWLSEIILQQTRVSQGLPYYERFTEKFPTVYDLANASEQEVLKLWQGLGYYSRARNLHHAAKSVVSEFNGIFPDTHEKIIKLKGIGNYTAAAILSIAYDKPYAVLDGNVYRVLSRLYNNALPINSNAAEKTYSSLAQELLDKKNPAAFNEAMMELGATICTPAQPLCSFCPVKKECEALRIGTVNELPVKIKKQKAVDRKLDYLFLHNAKGLYLKKREAGDIWQGLYDFPEISIDKAMAAEPEAKYGKNIREIPVQTQKHLLSHQTLYISFYAKEIDAQGKSSYKDTGSAIYVKFNKLGEYPLPKPVEKFLKEYLQNPKLY